MERYFKITNGYDTEVYDPHYSFNKAIVCFRSIYGDSLNIKISYITKEEYLDRVIEKRRKEIKFI